MSANPDEVLVAEFSDVLEHMAFLFAEHVPLEDLPAPPEEGLLISMKFSGPIGGALRLAIPKRMGIDVMANFLGIDAEEATNPKMVQDAVKELLNVTCGHVTTSLAGAEPVFSLTTPQVEDLASETWESLKGGGHVAAFMVEEWPAILRLDLDHPA